LTFVPSSACKPSSTLMPSSLPNFFFINDPILVSSLHDANEDENPPFPAYLLLYESTEHEPTPTPSLPRWVCSIHEATRDLAADPRN
jgi:hypothetical protein